MNNYKTNNYKQKTKKTHTNKKSTTKAFVLRFPFASIFAILLLRESLRFATRNGPLILLRPLSRPFFDSSENRSFLYMVRKMIHIEKEEKNTQNSNKNDKPHLPKDA